LVVCLLTACSRDYVIKGSSNITSLDGQTLYLKTIQHQQWVTVDSAEVIHGLFTMRGTPDSVKMVTLCTQTEHIMPLVLEPGTITVNINNMQLTAAGTVLNDALYAFIDRRNAIEVLIEEVEKREARMMLEGAVYDEIHHQLQRENDSLVTVMNSYVKTFISENYGNVLGPGIFMMICSTQDRPFMTPQLEEIIQTAPLSFKNNPLVRTWLDQAKENRKKLEEYQRLQQNIREQPR
jgi:cell fate (sporulation/competence/biofilm development) regulator YlbF (YheA/YmcA/DUF963 family)